MENVAADPVTQKLAVTGDFNTMVAILVKVFGQKEAAKMLRAAAKLVAPEKEAA